MLRANVGACRPEALMSTLHDNDMASAPPNCKSKPPLLRTLPDKSGV